MSLAKDVAKELERRQRRRRILVLGGIAGLLILAFLYLRCGAGWGFGGDGEGEGKGTGTGTGTGQNLIQSDAQIGRCAMRVAAGGITVDGKVMKLEDAVKACGNGADFVCVGDARQGDCDAAKAALEAAHVPTYVAH